jgi:hypothetical protein
MTIEDIILTHLLSLIDFWSPGLNLLFGLRRKHDVALTLRDRELSLAFIHEGT